MNLESQIEALLFYKNEPVEIKKIGKLLETDEAEIKGALKNLSRLLEGRGICLIETETEVSLATAPGLKGLIEKVAKDEMSTEIGKAGLETLAIVLYNGPISRREIDFLRGVNSAFILRNLCIRGLIIREPDPKDQRIFRYKSSLPLLAHLGLRKAEELPEFASFREKIQEAVQEKEEDGEQI